jgi:hypothetical protein
MDMFAVENTVLRMADRCHACDLLPTRTYYAVWNHCYLMFEKEGLQEVDGSIMLDEKNVRVEVKMSMVYEDQKMPYGMYNMLLDVRDAVRTATRLGLREFDDVGTWHYPGRFTEDEWHHVVEGTAKLAIAQERRRMRANWDRWLARAMRPGQGALWAYRERCRLLLRRFLRGWVEVATRPAEGRLYLLYKRHFEATVATLAGDVAQATRDTAPQPKKEMA